MPIVLFYRNFLEDFRADDFATKDEAKAFVRELEAKEKPEQSIYLLHDANDLLAKTGPWRKSVFDLISSSEGDGGALMPSKPDEKISAERLWERLEVWMKL